MNIKHLACAVVVSGALGVGYAAPAFSAEAPRQGQPRRDDTKERKGPVYTSAEQAPKDYKIQGEYAGEVGGKKLGLQVITRLKRGTEEVSFVGVIFPGGLPGDGSDGKAKREVTLTYDGNSAKSAPGPATILIGPDGGAAVVTFEGQTARLTKVVRKSPTLGAKPPAGATVIYDGGSVEALAPGAKVDERKFLVVPVMTKQKFGDCTVHVEFMSPYMPQALGQDRGNSGVYLQQRYEVQILDSFGLKGEDNECGGIYRNAAPKVNMCFPPLTWQTFDIDFTAAKWEGDKKVANAKVTIRHNGVVIHEDQEITGTTGGGQKEAPTPGALYIQGHGDQVFARNIWVVEKK